MVSISVWFPGVLGANVLVAGTAPAALVATGQLSGGEAQSQRVVHSPGRLVGAHVGLPAAIVASVLVRVT